MLEGWTILIVEDEMDSLEVAKFLLEMYSATVIWANNGNGGLALARQHRPHFILSDLSMPGMSGLEMIHQLKDDPDTKNIPVIALTAHAMTGDKERALTAGFHGYLSKPLEPDTFVTELLAALKDVPAIAQLLDGSPNSNGSLNDHQ